MQNINYFVPTSLHNTQLLSFYKPIWECGLIPYADSSLFTYRSASIQSHFLLYSYPVYLELNNYMLNDFTAHISTVSVGVTPKTKFQLGHLLAM